ESLGDCISFVVQDSQYIYTASPWTPRICNLRNLCNIKVNLGNMQGSEALERIYSQGGINHAFV
ncbi:MAG TPA: hypothetical protein VK564_01575, partial [Thermodesulfobacteriota bacterium]|nr:hypothetical protein [Thermodesulfobacteriota bacterium]